MNYAPKNRVWTIAALATPCVSLDAMREHLRFPDSLEDAVISGKIMAAQRAVEKYTQRLLTRRTVTLRLPSLPTGACPIELPGGEIGTVSGFTVDGVAVTGAQTFGDSPAVILPADEWPVPVGIVYPVQITYQAGFAVCPDDLKAAVMLLAAELFERRANAESASLSEVPVSAQYLMAPWRIRPV